MKEHMEINKAIWDLKMVIKKSHTFNGARWKRPYFNNPGVYNIILNIQQLTIIHKALKKLNKQGKTVIMVTHDADLAKEHADKIYWLKDGKIEKITKG